jgi:hypothetical protein
MPNYPSSLDTLANPGPTTNQDDSGYELDIVIGRIHDILEALELKLGTGASVAVTQSLLNGIGSGSASWQTSPTVSGTFTATGGLKSTPTGTVEAGGAIYPSNQTTSGWRVISAAAVVTNTSTVDIGATICVVTILNHSTGQSTIVGLMGAAATVVAHSPTTTGFTINSDTGANIRIFWNADRYYVRNNAGSSQTLTIWAMGA